MRTSRDLIVPVLLRIDSKYFFMVHRLFYFGKFTFVMLLKNKLKRLSLINFFLRVNFEFLFT